MNCILFLPYIGLGIGIHNYGDYPLHPSFHGAIVNNHIYVKTDPANAPNVVSAGVMLNYTNKVKVQGNTIGLTNVNPPFSESSRFYGVLKTQGIENDICDNNISGQAGYDRGVGSVMSPGYVTCNLIEHTRWGMLFTGDNEASNHIRGNEMSDAYIGLRVTNEGSFQTNLGAQNLMGNQWVNVSHRGGLGTDWLDDYVADSKFKNWDDLPYSPVAEVEPPSWFEPDPVATGNTFNACEEVVGVASVVCTNGKKESPLNRRLVKKSKDLKEPYRSIVLRKAYSELYSEYYGQAMPDSVKAYLNEYAETGLAQLTQIDYLLGNPLAAYPLLDVEIEKYADSLETKMPDYEAFLDSVSHGQISGGALIHPAVEAVRKLSSQLATLTQVADMFSVESLSEAKQMNDHLVAEDDYVALEQRLNKIYIAYLENEDQGISGEDSAFVQETAYLCPQEWGEAVFKARSFWLQLGGFYDKKWDNCLAPEDENQTANRLALKETKTPTSDGLPKIYPVPTSGRFIVVAPEPYIGGRYLVFNAMGELVSKGLLLDQSTMLDASTWSNGLYYVQLVASNIQPVTLKAIVQKQ